MDEHTELLIELMRKTIEQKDEQIQKLRETIEEFRRKFFGSSSEKTCQRKPRTQEEDETEEVTVKSYKRCRKPKSTRDELYQNLPVREIWCPMPEDGRLCPDCDTPMETIAWQYVREELSITPAKVERVRYLREVLACPVCHREDTGTITKALTPTALLAHSPASPSMVAFVMYQKFMNAVPFYRQEMDWLQMGAPLAREAGASNARWFISSRFMTCFISIFFNARFSMRMRRSARFCMKKERLRYQSPTCGFIYPEMMGLRRSSYMNTSPADKGGYARDFLEGFCGLLECDGYTGYNSVENVTLVCCLAHCRRYFFEAIPAARRRKMKLLDINSEEEIPEEAADPEKAIEKNKIPAEIGLCYCNQLFHTERKLKEMPAEEKKAERLKQEVPIWERFFAWLETLKPLKGSRLEKAVNYAVNHRELLCNYLLDGRCEISNNRAERCAKSYGTGRKNFLFHDTVNGAKSSAVIYSLVYCLLDKYGNIQNPYQLSFG